MNTLVKQLLLGGSATALIAGATFHAAYAQPADASASNSIETVEVSASRINMAGFQSPTPVTVIGLEQIERNARLDIADEIRDLPEVQGSSANSASNGNNAAQGNAGVNTLNLRGLGAQRNLVLIDRQRVVSSAIQDGTVDLATIPSSLVQRVDVVTGGASAAWGSDAVTGVINLVINKQFEGFKGNAEFSNNMLISRPQYKAEAAWGASFLGGKGHIEFAANTLISNTPTFSGQNTKNNGRAFVYNPAYCSQVTYTGTATTGGTCTALTGQPLLTYAYGTGADSTTQGGLINGNTVGTTGSGLTLNSLKGINFVGQNATPTPFNYGTTYGTTCYNGCSNDQYSGIGPWGLTSAPYHQNTFFNYTSYQITPDIKASVQLNYGHFVERNTGATKSSSTQVIYADNAYLEPSIAQRFACNGTAGAACVTTLSNGYNPFTGQGASSARPSQTLQVGWDFVNNRVGAGPSSGDGGKPDWTMDNLCSGIGQPCNNMARTLQRAVFTLEGSLSDDWTWSAYAQSSEVRVHQTLANNPISTRLNNALDAVRVTSSNVGTSGLPLGSIQCRVLLQAATASAFDDRTGCQPLDLFGYNNVSNQARNWIAPGLNQASSGVLDQETVHLNQVSAGLDINGVLPWKLPAGDISVAAGGEYRLEQAGQFNTDPRSAATSFNAGNFAPWEGHLHVEEGFVEVAAPLLKDQWVQSLDIDVAGRITSYSSEGDSGLLTNGVQPAFNFTVETWKLGFNTQINDDWRVRGFYSYDIRAPIVFDLYNPGAFNSQQCASWLSNGAPNTCFAKAGGNTSLVPEKANTVALGIVMTPHWLDGFTASLDWYDLQLHGGMITTAFNTVISRAKAGEHGYCANILDSAGDDICSYPQTSGTPPIITQVNVGAVNASKLTTAGFDAKIQYSFPLFTGAMTLSVAGNYVYDWSQTLNGIYFQGAGGGGYYGGGANFSGNLQAAYRQGPWTFSAETHFTGDSEKDLGTEGQAGLVYRSVTFNRVGGQDVAVVGSGQSGAGITSTNYNAWGADIGGRVQYRWSDNVQLYAAMDRVFPGNKSYRAGVRFNF